MKRLTGLEWTIGLSTILGFILTVIMSCTSCSPTYNVTPPDVKIDMHVTPPPMKVDVNVPPNDKPVDVHIHPRPRRFPRRDVPQKDKPIGEPKANEGATYDCPRCLSRFVAVGSKCQKCGATAALARWSETIGGDQLASGAAGDE